MKRSGLILLGGILVSLLPVNASGLIANQLESKQIKKANPVQVYYFHLTRRCVTCQTVEKVAEDAVKENFPEAMLKGDITFKSINLEEKENKDLAKKLKVSGQTLLIVNGNEKIDITDKGFLYAVKEPDKLKTEIKNTVQKYLK